jgi:hypothetical protein
MEKPVASVKLKDNNSSASNASTVPGEIVSKEADNEEK